MDSFVYRMKTNQYGGLANYPSADWRHAPLFVPEKSGVASLVTTYIITTYHQSVQLETVMSLHEVEGDIPVDPALYSVPMDISSAELVGYTRDYDWYRIETPVSWHLEHQRYALVLTPQVIPSTLQAHVMEFRRTGWQGEKIIEGTTGALKLILSMDGGATWITQSSMNLSFQIWGTFDEDGGNGNGNGEVSYCCWPWLFAGVAVGLVAKAAYPKMMKNKGAKYEK